MKHLKHIIIITLASCFTLIAQNNSIVFSPVNQDVTTNSGEEIEVTINARGFGSNLGASSYIISPHEIPDNGFLSQTPVSGSLFPGNVNAIVFRFRRTVSSSTTTNYIFRQEWFDEEGNPNGGFLNINVTYTGIPVSTTCSLPSPSQRSTTNITAESVTLNWGAISGNNGYGYQYKKESSNSWIGGSSFGSSQIISNLEANTVYNWRIRTRCNNGVFGSWSSILDFVTPDLCVEHTTLNSVVSNSEFTEVSNSITSSSRIENGADVVYSAGETINLVATPNFSFHAKRGSEFLAIIEGCSPSNSGKIVSNNQQKKKIIAPKSFSQEISIYPNPTDSNVIIKSLNNIEHWTLYNTLGVVFKQKTNIYKKSILINLNTYPNGMYLLRLQLEDGTIVTKQIIKQ